jgi:hypothetical protein
MILFQHIQFMLQLWKARYKSLETQIERDFLYEMAWKNTKQAAYNEIDSLKKENKELREKLQEAREQLQEANRRAEAAQTHASSRLSQVQKPKEQQHKCLAIGSVIQINVPRDIQKFVAGVVKPNKGIRNTVQTLMSDTDSECTRTRSCCVSRRTGPAPPEWWRVPLGSAACAGQLSKQRSRLRKSEISQ